jgi:hypothetical protein
MKVRLVFFALIMMLCAGFSACSSRSPETLKNDADQKAVNVVALLPVENQTGDVRASKMLRLKISDELRFKGYPQVAIEVIDERLAALAGGREAGKNDAASPAFIRETLGADAAMYCCLMESKAAKKIFYTPVTVSVRCELRSTATGETLWNAQGKSTGRSFDLRGKTLDMKAAGDLEAVLEEVVGQVMESLPYGPKLRG